MTQNMKPRRDEHKGRTKLNYFTRFSLKLQKKDWMKHMEPEFHGKHRITLSLKMHPPLFCLSYQLPGWETVTIRLKQSCSVPAASDPHREVGRNPVQCPKLRASLYLSIPGMAADNSSRVPLELCRHQRWQSFALRSWQLQVKYEH